MEDIKERESVLLIWSGISPSQDLQEIVGRITELTGVCGKVSVEHVDRLKLSSHTESSFDHIYSGVTFPSTFIHDLDILAEIARILKPSGSFLLRQPTGNINTLVTQDKLVSTLKLSGFVDISQGDLVETTEEQLKTLQDILKTENKIDMFEIKCKKPSFNVGTSTKLKLSFSNKKEIPSENAAKVWTLSAQDMNDDDVDIIDSDDLLDENDRKKPDPSTLKSACGPKSGKKKACKNCTCGLAEDLANGVEGAQPKSACGSCYLGDAFRCASCPYLGMPAFKPGDKISLSDRQLKPDI
ncbi:anamorsin homolog [Dendronephthya gigantea]|uniref:anamorsin homolog n=1 Tax=Dendronephthya gigantea TaxID=151771 RepID=UPI00106D0EC2|nr:anamorsin homolog [Dendronephthya gigantea]